MTSQSPSISSMEHSADKKLFGPDQVLIRRHVSETGICVLTFDRAESSANVFDRQTLTELNRHLDFVSSSQNLRGLVLTSAKEKIFLAGADILSLTHCRTPEKLLEFIDVGQGTFNRLAALKIPTIAAIHGACLGGGLEMCLACDYRIASPAKVTKLGLPETNLGILPAWGGSSRLPRQVGILKALEIILGGKILGASVALKQGLIDAIVPRELMVQYATQFALETGPHSRQHCVSLHNKVINTWLVSHLVAMHMRSRLQAKTRGHYPALIKALEVVTSGIRRSLSESLLLERDAILELAQNVTCKNLMRLFLLQERSKKLLGAAKAHTPNSERIKRVAVMGAGVMGSGITQWISSREIAVLWRDIHHEAIASGMMRVSKLFEEGVQRGALSRREARAGLDRISPGAQEVPLTRVDLVIEAAIEEMGLKQQLFRRLDVLTHPQTILASNTSALSITQLATVTQFPERVVGIHFFNPVHKMQLVEVVKGQRTAPDVVGRAVSFVQQIGKLPVVVKDSPGFLVNRILMPYLIEAGLLFERGARVEDLDEAMLDFGMPMGPLRLIDEVGLDVCNHVATDLASKFAERMHSPSVLARMIHAGMLGKKNGKGFYLYAKQGQPDVNPEVDGYSQATACASLSRFALRQRMVLLMVNEAARCLEEDVVSDPADVDFGMIMGVGWAPFRGGPLRYGDSVGASGLVREMEQLASEGELRFAPCQTLKEMAVNARQFYST